ncbi:LytR/AlgR family response regulator transcription factor [Tenacibaculum sp. M341]|uniref:LytR/AlgR family response regulator transcription factor n=1 Tax=Tenacibaculum sp. M341 TaxID=2530339 RepID=UPI001043DD18|nr:LytTR family DNA-binding domain-containing protein [Tenacibaculum sp. M341]TCI85553.1 response regulator transcription factor [Tenacibaculum sp. M341]
MSKVLNCLIVDDEPPAIRLLEKYISKISFLEVQQTFTSPLQALQHIEKDNFDIIFLDIQMPELTGLQLSKIINKKVEIIFTTAYPQFALESYDVAAIDYLLKPIDFERFYKAVLKVYNRFSNETITNTTSNTQNDFFFLKTDGKNKFVKVFLNEIVYIESLKNYVSIQLKDEQIITYSTLKKIKENLPEDQFIQIHKSHIVAIQHIEKIDNDAVFMQKKELSIGNTYKKSFFNLITNKQL